ncbi:sensor protein KdpD [Myroides marinus]|uniref:Two-component system, OmpR family, sensor histidine kinase KdpD n=1 Tax=Myroides marinus TaxID=703342 RepID=A0A1H6UIS6_9FLAO|nr:histidine kinase [Myroides marinus]MDM1346159.1 sensor protein KdpD [Myroides marinus]MDM1351146.1 sensor protein KdpD [Myroides marinus]MDM1353413.1 sensor protein KdpD [Myroides marinus]MDM1358338.1 sensor protein KdpD [Myroides marinus]MDM1362747.1 sensor protein KdpD [Myroides marinus]
MEGETRQSAEDFLALIRRSKRGKFKVYIGMSAGVGKTYRMLLEARDLQRNGIDVKLGFIETHNRKETHALLEGLTIIPRKEVFYKGKMVEELDLEAILKDRPEIVIIDELAHSNIAGSKNAKRWQDVMEILEAGINVISALNIQHIESLNNAVKEITSIDVMERVPDKVLQEADEVVNIDLTADDLRERLREGKIYPPDKVPAALQNFFTSSNILQLRELALKEVASHVENKVASEVSMSVSAKPSRFMACISSNDKNAKNVIRKTARLASYLNSKWYVLYVQTPKEHPDKIALDKQRHLINNFKLATELGAEIIKSEHPNIAKAIMTQVEQRQVTTICIGKPRLRLYQIILATNVFNQLLKKLTSLPIDIIIFSK